MRTSSILIGIMALITLGCPNVAPSKSPPPPPSAEEDKPKEIDFCGTKIPKNAQKVTCHDASVTSLAPLRELPLLEEVDVSQSSVDDLSPLGGLHHLTLLNITGTKVDPDEPFNDFDHLVDLSIIWEEAPPFGFHDASDPDCDESRERCMTIIDEGHAFDRSVLWMTGEDYAPFDGSILARLIFLKELDLTQAPKIRSEDLEFLQGLTRLRTLRLTGTQITDLAPLSQLIALRHLELGLIPAQDFSVLARMTQLESVNLSGTGLTDLAPAQEWAKLDALNIAFTRVANLAPLKNLVHLERLNLNYTAVQDLSPLINQTKLTHISFAYTKVRRMITLANMTQLKELDAEGSRVRNLKALSLCAGLERINISFTDASDLSPLAKITTLRWLDIYGTKVTDLTPLYRLTNLTQLKVAPDQFTEEQLAKLQEALPKLRIDRGTKIEGEPHTKTEIFMDGKESQTAIDLRSLRRFPKLDRVDIEGPVRTVRPLEQCQKLTKLQVVQTQPGPVDLTSLGSLGRLEHLSLRIDLDDLDFLASLRGLTSFALHQASVADYAPIASLTNLTRLDLSESDIQDAKVVSSLVQLRVLNLSMTDIDDFSPLGTLSQLQELFVSNTAFENLSEIEPLIHLETLYMDRTHVRSLFAPTTFPKLSFLSIKRSPISDITVIIERENVPHISCRKTWVPHTQIQAHEIKVGGERELEHDLLSEIFGTFDPQKNAITAVGLRMDQKGDADLSILMHFADISALTLGGELESADGWWDGKAVMDRHLKILSGFTKLVALDLGGTLWSNLELISHMAALETLSIPASVTTLGSLTKLKSLKTLLVPATMLESAPIKDLQQKLPGLEVRCDERNDKSCSKR